MTKPPFKFGHSYASLFFKYTKCGSGSADILKRKLKLDFIRVSSSSCAHLKLSKSDRKGLSSYNGAITVQSRFVSSSLNLVNVRELTTLPNTSTKAQGSPIAVLPLTAAQKFVGNFPNKFQPYLRLSRIDRPIGTWLLFWPSTWGLTAAAGGMPDLTLLALFGAGAFVMRSAGCTVNDMWDRQIDPKVKRTSSRPLASRELRMRHATAWLAGQLSIAFGILLQLNPSCFLISCGALGLVCLYPLAKRVTYWPQAVLGLTFNTGILIGFAAARTTQVGFLDMPYLDPTCLSLYAAGVFWTLIYDTIYAHQDLQDDTLLGLGSTARRFGENTKIWLSGFSCLMLSSLTMAGISAEMAWPYYAGIFGVSTHLLWQIQTLNIKNADNCGERFTANRHIGWMILVSMLASYWMKNEENKDNLKNKIIVETDKRLPVEKYTRLAKTSI